MNVVKGDLIALAKQGNFDAIAHSCNCFCAMRSGIAPKIAEAFPAAKLADDATVRANKHKLGNYSVGIEFVEDDEMLQVFNLYGQYGWDRSQVNYGTSHKDLFLSLRNMRDRLDLMSLETIRVGFPRIGAGLGGGDWDLISQMIVEVFKPPRYEVTYVDFSK